MAVDRLRAFHTRRGTYASPSEQDRAIARSFRESSRAGICMRVVPRALVPPLRVFVFGAAGRARPTRGSTHTPRWNLLFSQLTAPVPARPNNRQAFRPRPTSVLGDADVNALHSPSSLTGRASRPRAPMFLSRSVLAGAGMLAGGKRALPARLARAVGAQPPLQLRRPKSTAVDTEEVRVHPGGRGWGGVYVGTGLDTVRAR